MQKAVESAEVSETVLVGDDTDLLVLLIYHANTQQHNIYFVPEQKRNSKQRSWDIKQVKATLGSFICKHILYIHAFVGSDTTSRPFSIGKGAIVKKFKTNTVLKQSAAVFDSLSSTKEEIAAAGGRTFVALYGGIVAKASDGQQYPLPLS